MKFKAGQKVRYIQKWRDTHPHNDFFHIVFEVSSAVDRRVWLKWPGGRPNVWDWDHQLEPVEPDYIKILKETVL